MADASVTFFPVGNGDTSLTTLTDGTTIVIDINASAACADEDDKKHYDVPAALRDAAKRDTLGRPHHDVFVLSHIHDDHVLGFPDVFYTGDPKNYSEEDRKAGKILIDELWYAPRILGPYEKDLSDSARAFKREAYRRRKLYKEGSKDRSLPGNRLRIIGHTDDPDFSGLEDITTGAGQTVSLINGSVKPDFQFFVHAPFSADTDDETTKTNDTSVVLHARFAVDGAKNGALVMFTGDAECAVWEAIVDRSKSADLQWDLLKAAHHCSWTFFSQEPSEDGEPSEKVLDFMDERREGAVVVASSKPIKNDDDNPPHYRAKELYVEEVGEHNFFCTMEEPSEESPQPLHFRMTKKGPQKGAYPRNRQAEAAAAWGTTLGKPKSYGR